jgi:hypothetical protein
MVLWVVGKNGLTCHPCALTHLSLSPRISGALLPRIVAECPKIQVVTIFMAKWRQNAFADTVTISDARLVLIVVADYITDWQAGARSGVDVWARADEFLARKRMGEIPSECFH